jgi:hemerythrin superfamily protein
MEEIMATRTQSRSSSGSRSRAGQRNDSAQTAAAASERSAFSWKGGGTGPLLGAALAGVALGFAANMGRKLVVQGMTGMAGDWDEVLATEHDMTLALFDKMLATDSSQTWKRSMLLMKLEHALDKHAHTEEMVVYPALREANMNADSEHLNAEHLEIKTFLYELHQMGADSPEWLETVRRFRSVVERHARMEEEQVFPRFKEELDEQQNARITNLLNRDGFWRA